MSDSNWIDLVAVSDLEPGDVTPAQHKGQPLAVYDGPDGIHVTSARCSHGGASLVDGYFDARAERLILGVVLLRNNTEAASSS